MARTHILLAGVIVSGVLHTAPAFAFGEPSSLSPVSLPDSPVGHPDASDSGATKATLPQAQFGNDAPFTNAAVIDEAKLADVRGMADVKVVEQSANASNTSTVSGNIINGDPTTGTISFDGGSFGNFNGLALISVNTGNNVSINSAMNVNVALQ